MIINLCSERTYQASKFNNRVRRFPFDDHNPPPLPVMLKFCIFVEEFLNSNKKNVVAIHCKGGKGRTGTMICAWLLYSRKDLYTEQVLQLFAHQRTNENKSGTLQGVAGPSQIRYINYFEKLRLTGLKINHKTEADILGVKKLLNVYQQPYKVLNLNAIISYLEQAPKVALVSLRLNHLRLKQHDDKTAKKYTNSNYWSLLITQYPANKKINQNFLNDDGGLRYKYCEAIDYIFNATTKDDDVDDSIFIDIISWQQSSKSQLSLSGDLRFQIYKSNTKVRSSKKKTTFITTDKINDDSILFCSFWIHSSFLRVNGAHLILQKAKIDEAYKNNSLHSEFNIDLEYILTKDDIKYDSGSDPNSGSSDAGTLSLNNSIAETEIIHDDLAIHDGYKKNKKKKNPLYLHRTSSSTITINTEKKKKKKNYNSKSLPKALHTNSVTININNEQHDDENFDIFQM